MGQPHLATDERFRIKTSRSAHSGIVNRIVEGWTLQHTKAELTRILGGKVPFGPVNDVTDIFADPHVAARAMIASVPHADPNRQGWRVAVELRCHRPFAGNRRSVQLGRIAGQHIRGHRPFA
jgi:crotonobetainyl-CoA:carnitine CoA-transferase CaiB-like acyl-CoA transferase